MLPFYKWFGVKVYKNYERLFWWHKFCVTIIIFRPLIEPKLLPEFVSQIILTSEMNK